MQQNQALSEIGTPEELLEQIQPAPWLSKPRIGTLEAFIQEVFGEDAPRNGETELPIGLVLGVEKYRQPSKHYRLIWIGRGQAWLAAEDLEAFHRRKGDALAVGRALAEKTGAYFDEQTR